MINQDFEAFKANISWFVKPNVKIKFKSDELRLSEEFKSIFPVLTSLIQKSRTTFLDIDSTSYVLFAWNNKRGEISGWLNKLEDEESRFCELISKHELLLRNVGGMQESFDQPIDALVTTRIFYLPVQTAQGELEVGTIITVWRVKAKAVVKLTIQPF